MLDVLKIVFDFILFVYNLANKFNIAHWNALLYSRDGLIYRITFLFYIYNFGF